MQIVRFRVAGRDVAFRVDEVREVVSTTRVAAVFRAPPFVAGLMNLRGEAVPLFDLATLFRLPVPTERPGKVVVGEHGLLRAGFLADPPVDIMDVAPGAEESLPEGTATLAALDRVLLIEGEPILLLSLERLFDLPEMVALRSDVELLGR